MRRKPHPAPCKRAVAGLWLGFLAGMACASECIAPAKPRGGFGITCELLKAGLRLGDAAAEPMGISHMPGGVGAVTYNAMITRRNAEPDTVVAFSGGSLFNIAQGRFGIYTERDVKWLAAFGIDYGVLIVRGDSPFKTFKDLIDALRKRPGSVVFGGSGTIRGQDWMKAGLVAQAAGGSVKAMRFVGFEGGGEANAALSGRHVDVVSGDLSEAMGLIGGGVPLRVLVVFAGERLPGKLKAIPTAREAGYEIVWSNIRGVYMGPRVSGQDYGRWVALMNKMLVHPEFIRQREQMGLLPFSKTGRALDSHINDLVKQYRRQAEQSGLLGAAHPPPAR